MTTSCVWSAYRQGTGHGGAMTRRPGTRRSRLGLWQFSGRFQSLDGMVTWLESWARLVRLKELTGGVEFEVFLQVGMAKVTLLIDLLDEMANC